MHAIVARRNPFCQRAQRIYSPDSRVRSMASLRYRIHANASICGAPNVCARTALRMPSSAMPNTSVHALPPPGRATDRDISGMPGRSQCRNARPTVAAWAPGVSHPVVQQPCHARPVGIYTMALCQCLRHSPRRPGCAADAFCSQRHGRPHTTGLLTAHHCTA